MPDLSNVSAEVVAVLESNLPDGLNDTLREIAMSLYLYLIDDAELLEKVGLARLAEIAVEQTDRVSIDVGGTSFYMPKGIGCKLSARDREIGERFNGRNGHELAREFRVSDTRIGQICKKWRQTELARRQGTLALD